MREDVTFCSVIGPFNTLGVYGLQAMTLSFTRDADHVVTDLSSQALLSYEPCIRRTMSVSHSHQVLRLGIIGLEVMKVSLRLFEKKRA